MPTYVYTATDKDQSCDRCGPGFEVVQRISEKPLTQCPHCRQSVRRILFAPAVVIKGSPVTETDKKIKEYEREGKWSHAAELADKHSEKVKDKGLKMRALDDYKKAGYDTDSLAKHANTNQD